MGRRKLGSATAAALLVAISSLNASAQQVVSAQAGVRLSVVASDSTRSRPKAIEYSDAYETRLKIHRWGSYAELPIFAAEWYLGDKLLQQNHGDWVKPSHAVVASALGLLFVSNTVTGVWNLAESNKDPSGRTRRWVHSLLMLAADAGFAYTGTTAGDAGGGDDDFTENDFENSRNRHKNAALVSMGIATVGTAMMWLWKD